MLVVFRDVLAHEARKIWEIAPSSPAEVCARRAALLSLLAAAAAG